MKKNHPPLQHIAVLLCSLAAMGAAQAATVALPSDVSGPAGSASNRGFTVRTAQAPEANVVGNSFIRAIKQLNGTLTDADGVLVANEANPGPGTGGAYAMDTVNYELNATVFDTTDMDGNVLVSFTPELFPGIPGSGGHLNSFAVEVVGFLELPQGQTTFGISVGADRTDVNDDDGYQLLVGRNPRDLFATKVAEYERLARGFTSDQHIENRITVDAPVAGIYPFRLVYWQTGHGANLNWYSILSDTGERVLINDPNDTRAIKAYRDSSIAAATSPYIGEVSPNPGSAGNSASAPVVIVLLDGQTTVKNGSIQLSLNGTSVTPQAITKTGSLTRIQYDPSATRSNPDNLMRLIYTDSANALYTNTWQFTINVTGGSATTITGQWDFDQGDLRATVGQALEYLDGPAGMTAAGTLMGTTGQGAFADVPPINGAPAKVMFVPGDLSNKIGYVMKHGIAPNGGGTKVNQYTLIMDILVGTTGPGAASLLQVSSLNNTDDGDLFWQGNNFGQGTDGYKGTGAFTPGEWHRVVAAYDEAANPPVVTKFVDGIKQDDWTTNQGLDNPRRALQESAVLFGDGDQDERRPMWVNSVQIRSGKMSDAELVLLGGPSADGIPQRVPQSSVSGQWDFNRGDLSATIGKPLQYLDGAEGLTKAGTLYGTTGEGDFADVPNIAGTPAKVMFVPGDLSNQIGYIMDHGILPNGGGTKVNQYTLIMDILMGTTGPGAASLLQVSSLNNTDDGDLFWQGSNFGQGTDGYKGTGAFTAGEWHRVVAAYDEAATPPVVTKFVDGIKQDDWTANQGLDNPRRAMQATAVLFGDGDQDERRPIWVNSIQIRAGKMSDAQMVQLGGPSADGIPVYVPTSTVTGQWDFDQGNLAATVGKPLQYLDGAEGFTQAGTFFGTTGESNFVDVPNIGGSAAKVMYVPGDLSNQIGYIMDHGIQPNGGGTKVNQYTLIMDILIGTTGPGAASLLQTSSLNNTDDGDLFWQGNNFGQGTDGYKGTGAFTAGEWHRVIAAYNEGAQPPVVTKFVDGIFQDDWTANQSLDNPRRALQATAVLFGDGDQDERREMWVNSIQIRAGALSKEEMTALGGPSAKGIPVAIAGVAPVEKPTITMSRGTGTLTLSWASSATGFTLESTTALGSSVWTAVAGVANNSVTVPTTGTVAQFYRLRR